MTKLIDSSTLSLGPKVVDKDSRVCAVLQDCEPADDACHGELGNFEPVIRDQRTQILDALDLLRWCN